MIITCLLTEIKLVIMPTTMNSFYTTINFVLDFHIIQDKNWIRKIIMLLLLVKMLVKVIQVDLLFARLMTKQFWLVWFLTEVDVAKQDIQEFTRKSIISTNGFVQVNFLKYYFLIPSVVIFNFKNSVYAEPTFVFLSNPVPSVYNPMQISFFGKNEIWNKISWYIFFLTRPPRYLNETWTECRIDHSVWNANTFFDHKPRARNSLASKFLK